MRTGKEGNIRKVFSTDQILELDHAIEISEDIIGDHFKISTSQWKRYRYDIKSLRDLQEAEITDEAFAQILRYAQHPNIRMRGSEWGEYFKICLQDHVILRAMETQPDLLFLPFMVYIITHELIHVVRFARFVQSFYASERERLQEEAVVHSLTQDLLSRIKLSGMKETLHFFSKVVQMEIFLG